MWTLLGVSSPKEDKSAEAVEKLRLECFCNSLHALGLKTSLTWKGTQYRLVIKKGWWPFTRTVQTLSREIVLSKPMAKWEWEPPTDCYTECALTSLYQGALECALGAMHISLDITEEMQYAVRNFQSNLAYGLRAFPVQYLQEIDDPPIFWVVSANSLTDKDHEFARFIWPNIDVRSADPEKYPHIYRYLNFFLERYFGGIRTPYGEIITGCGCLDDWDKED